MRALSLPQFATALIGVILAGLAIGRLLAAWWK